MSLNTLYVYLNNRFSLLFPVDPSPSSNNVPLHDINSLSLGSHCPPSLLFCFDLFINPQSGTSSTIPQNSWGYTSCYSTVPSQNLSPHWTTCSNQIYISHVPNLTVSSSSTWSIDLRITLSGPLPLYHRTITKPHLFTFSTFL